MPEYFIINILSELIVFLLNDDVVCLLKQYGNKFINFLAKISGSTNLVIRIDLLLRSQGCCHNEEIHNHISFVE